MSVGVHPGIDGIFKSMFLTKLFNVQCFGVGNEDTFLSYFCFVEACF